jgi:AraC-like DNA-binding protein
MTVALQLQSLRESLATAPRSGIGRPYPVALRRQACSFARSLCPSSMSLAQLASLLGLSPFTLARWLRELSAEPCFQPVVVFDSAPVDSEPCFSVLGPCGLRVDGMSLQQLAHLFRVLS